MKFNCDFKAKTNIKYLLVKIFAQKLEVKLSKNTFTSSAVFLYFITSRTLTLVGTWSVNAAAHTKAIIFKMTVKLIRSALFNTNQLTWMCTWTSPKWAFINIFAGNSISPKPISTVTNTLITSWCIDTFLFAVCCAQTTFVNIYKYDIRDTPPLFLSNRSVSIKWFKNLRKTKKELEMFKFFIKSWKRFHCFLSHYWMKPYS